MNRNELIIKLFNGVAGEYYNLPYRKESLELSEAVDAASTALTDKFKEHSDLFDLFNKYERAHGDLEANMYDAYYAEGFRMGFLLCMDILKADT